MALKPALLSIVIILASSSVFAQNHGLQKLRGFDEKSYKNRLELHGKLMPYMLDQHSPSIKTKEENAISNLRVGEKGMARIPKMKINKDINYSMQIKELKLQYPYSKPDRIEKNLNKKELETH